MRTEKKKKKKQKTKQQQQQTAKKQRNQETILREKRFAHPFGLLCFRPLVFFGLCQVRWQFCYLAGISGMRSITRTFGTWFQGA